MKRYRLTKTWWDCYGSTYPPQEVDYEEIPNEYKIHGKNIQKGHDWQVIFPEDMIKAGADFIEEIKEEQDDHIKTDINDIIPDEQGFIPVTMWLRQWLDAVYPANIWLRTTQGKDMGSRFVKGLRRLLDELDGEEIPEDQPNDQPKGEELGEIDCLTIFQGSDQQAISNLFVKLNEVIDRVNLLSKRK